MDKLLKKMDSLDPDERKRLRTLLQEKGDKKTEVQWMYKCDKPDTEEYLLGRRIDKHVDDPKEDDEANKDAPGALFEEVIAKRSNLDMHTKMREDPLYAIRRTEEEARKKLLQNPIKMKHLQKMIDEKEKSKTSKRLKDKKKKKHKKHKKRKHRSSSSSSDSDDSLVRQYLAVVKKKQKMSTTSRSEDEQGENKKRSYGLINAVTQECIPTKHRHQRESDEEKHVMCAKQESESVRKGKHGRNSRHETESVHGERQRKKASVDRTLSPHESRHHRRSRSRERSRHQRSEPQSEFQKSKRVDRDEMERKRQEMLENARWRDEQRAANVKKYKEQADNENKESSKSKSGADFIKPLLMEHASHSSVADRIKRNINSIQRTTADLDKNFTKH